MNRLEKRARELELVLVGGEVKARITFASMAGPGRHDDVVPASTVVPVTGEARDHFLARLATADEDSAQTESLEAHQESAPAPTRRTGDGKRRHVSTGRPRTGRPRKEETRA